MDGGWSSWGKWHKCSKTCGTGSQYRLRTCTRPPPGYGGKRCVGSDKETRICNTRHCPGAYHMIIITSKKPFSFVLNLWLLWNLISLTRLMLYLRHHSIAWDHAHAHGKFVFFATITPTAVPGPRLSLHWSSINHDSVSQSVGQPVIQSFSHSVSQSVNQSIYVVA